jgi:hypothetical protein
MVRITNVKLSDPSFLLHISASLTACSRHYVSTEFSTGSNWFVAAIMEPSFLEPIPLAAEQEALIHGSAR